MTTTEPKRKSAVAQLKGLALMGWSAPLHSDGLEGRNGRGISTTERATWTRRHESGSTWQRRFFT